MGAPPRVAVLGAGYWGRNLIRNFHALDALVAVCEPDEAARESIAKLYPDIDALASVHEALARGDIDAVAIATPAATHAALAEQAILAGKDVFVEKPLALTVADGRRIDDLARNRGRILMVGHLLWYHPGVLRLAQMLRSGELGELRYIYSHRLNLGKIRREENILWSFAPHDISVIMGLVGESPERIAASGATYLQPHVADTTITTLSFPGGVRAHVFVSWLHPFKEQRLVLVGSKMMAVFSDTEAKDKLVVYPHVIDQSGQVPVPHRAEARPVPLPDTEPLRAECAHFLDCVAHRSTPRTDGQEGLRVLGVLEACEAQLRSGG